ncbi:MAG: trp RNA-binding attenuation protein MtrB [Limnochordia bacterium]|jgi:transcription attenuation protein (tryptophan RNA-binding attenuator protein)|nr:trp RNA-binding attenuation protein MtrB [Limnochordia bacterium]MDI9464555.1 trp RNA-binding attenuation protein MtrB [Bacillota bacterium]HAN94610.1 trp RNA-binding attenuation protein MtrB [Bacillota bacterium]HOB39630.1 trp RNA-binding attenuation protein MtrB [Limnochordia bacterium]HOK30459.1 trp RNA-binding attenuation protein MtrB [Limnochordia bacterium]
MRKIAACGEVLNVSAADAYIMIQALEDGVTVIGLTRGASTKFHHTEKLDKGEILLAQFTEHTSAIKIRGKARVFTNLGVAESE